jgi:hypothetical protein
MKLTQRQLINPQLFKKIYYERNEHTPYHPDRIPSGAERAYTGRGGKKLKIATAVAYRSHEAIRDDSIPEYTSEKEYSKKAANRNIMSKRVKPVEARNLKYWAEQVGLLMDNKEFERKWREQGKMSGAENSVYFDEESQRWFKRNTLTYHTTYLEFFYRLALHNNLFPESPYSLEGFVINDGDLEPVISQPHVKASRGANEVEVEEFMNKLGYTKIQGTNHDYINKEKGVKLEDMHDENILMDDEGNIYVVDPVIYLDDEGKKKRITSKDPLLHELT